MAVGLILVIEDDPKILGAVRDGLIQAGFSVQAALSGEEGFFLQCAQKFDAIILDIMLPGRSGLEILQAIRKKGDRTPVLVLTARDSVEDKVLGLDLGADDYLIKPFAMAELVARINALLRRGLSDPELKLSLGDLEMDVITRRVTRGARGIELTQKEYELLEYLLRHKGRPVTREMIAQHVWKETARITSLDNVIDVHIARLRRKVDGQNEGSLLKTIRGIGFALTSES